MDHPYQNPLVVQYTEGDSSLEREQFIPPVGCKKVVHTVMEGETIQSIAYRYYQDSGSWYKIADYNNIYNPLTELYEGLTLIVCL